MTEPRHDPEARASVPVPADRQRSAGHTPGPWTAAPLAGGDYLVYQDVPPEAGENVAVVYVGMEVEANARLMAAAWLLPELRETLEHYIEIRDLDGWDTAEDRALLAQLDKALGA